MASSDRLPPRRAVMRLAPPDNIAVALRPLKAGETVILDDVPITVGRNIAVGHKLRGAGDREGRDHPQVQLSDRHGDEPDRAGRIRAYAQRREQLSPRPCAAEMSAQGAPERELARSLRRRSGGSFSAKRQLA